MTRRDCCVVEVDGAILRVVLVEVVLADEGAYGAAEVARLDGSRWVDLPPRALDELGPVAGERVHDAVARLVVEHIRVQVNGARWRGELADG